jgi:hypothetical protein
MKSTKISAPMAAPKVRVTGYLQELRRWDATLTGKEGTAPPGGWKRWFYGT